MPPRIQLLTSNFQLPSSPTSRPSDQPADYAVRQRRQQPGPAQIPGGRHNPGVRISGRSPAGIYRAAGRRAANGIIVLRVPPDVVKAQCARYRQRGKPWHRSRLQNLDGYDIVRIYGAEYRGVVNYYLLARNVSPDLVARFGGIILRQDRRAVIRDPAPAPAPYPRKELITRLRRRVCELCETGTTVAVHQVTGLEVLGQPGPGQPAWAVLMAKMRRKTLIVCAACHDWIHANPVAHAA